VRCARTTVGRGRHTSFSMFSRSTARRHDATGANMDLDTSPRVSATQRTRKLVPILAGCALVGGAYATGAAAGSDSRMTPGSTRCFQATGEPGDIAILNVTMVDANGPGFVTVRSPDDSDSRTFSN